MTSDRLNDAVQLIRSGDKQAALPLLKEILRENPADENAWLWLHVCVEDVAQKKYCLQRALEINPHNQSARNALRKLTEPLSQPVEAPSQMTDRAETVIGPDQRPWFLALVVGALLILCLAGVAISLALSGQISSLYAGLPLFPSATMTVSITPNIIGTPSPTSTVTSISTRRPSRTPIPVQPTFTPTPTIAAFTPGNPTATPLGSEITDANFIKGLAAYDAENYQLVIELMNEVIAAHPDLAPPYRYRGISYWNLEDCSAALADSEKALSINPDYAIAWSDLGLAHQCLGDDAQSLRDFQKALSLDGSLAVVHHNLGVYYYEQGNYEKAQEEYSLSVAIDPNHSEALNGAGDALAAMGKFDECIARANQALQKNQHDWAAYFSRAACELSKGSYGEAVRDYKVYVTNVPGDSIGSYNLGVAYGHRGNTYFDAGQYDLAIADYEQAVSLIKGDAHSYCNLSYAYFDTKQYSKALKAARASLAINPSCGGQKLVVIEALSAYTLKDYEAGIEYMSQALATGSYPLGYYYRGVMYQEIGKEAEAIQDFTHFIETGGSGAEAADARARLARLKT
jgi:tetratricopeptide (TPR) repeat protein